MEQPFFSIIIPTYNREDLIISAIESVRNQIFQNWELLIIDDGSTDDTKSKVSSYKNIDIRIKYHYQSNSGRSSARNKGIATSKGKFICFLDSDDYFLPNHLQVFYEVIQKNDYQPYFYYCHTFEDNNGNLKKVGEVVIKSQNVFRFLFENPIGTPRVCLAKSTLSEEQFDSSLSFGEDNELWLRLMPLKIICTNTFTQAYRNHANRSISQGSFSILENIKIKKRIYNKYRKHIPFSSYRKVIGYNYLKLARLCLGRNKLKCILYTIKSILLSPSEHLKEKGYLLMASTSIIKSPKA